jgi:hypothetical protein
MNYNSHEPLTPPYLECYFHIESWPAIRLRDIYVSLNSKFIYEDHSAKLKAAQAFLIYSGELTEGEHVFDIHAELAGEKASDPYIQPIYLKGERFSVKRNERLRCDAYISEKGIAFNYSQLDTARLKKVTCHVTVDGWPESQLLGIFANLDQALIFDANVRSPYASMAFYKPLKDIRQMSLLRVFDDYIPLGMHNFSFEFHVKRGNEVDTHQIFSKDNLINVGLDNNTDFVFHVGLERSFPAEGQAEKAKYIEDLKIAIVKALKEGKFISTSNQEGSGSVSFKNGKYLDVFENPEYNVFNSATIEDDNETIIKYLMEKMSVYIFHLEETEKLEYILRFLI